MTVPALFFVVPVTTPSVVEQVFEPSCGAPVVNLSNLPAPVAPQQVHPIVVVVVDAVVVVVVTVVVVVATGAVVVVVVVVVVGVVVVVVAASVVVVAASVVVVAASVVVVAASVVVVAASVVVVAASVVVVAASVVVVGGTDVVVLPGGGHVPPAPHASQQLGTWPTHAVPPCGALHSAALCLMLHFAVPRASVRQQVTESFLPQTDFAAHRITESRQACRSEPLWTAASATWATQLT